MRSLSILERFLFPPLLTPLVCNKGIVGDDWEIIIFDNGAFSPKVSPPIEIFDVELNSSLCKLEDCNGGCLLIFLELILIPDSTPGTSTSAESHLIGTCPIRYRSFHAASIRGNGIWGKIIGSADLNLIP